MVCLIIVLVGVASFNLGILSQKGGHEPIEIRNSGGIVLSDQTQASSSSVPPTESNSTSTLVRIVASKNGKAYFFTSCSGASRISEKNKIYFDSEDEAVKAGYYLAANCKNN